MYPAGIPGVTTRTLRLATGVSVRVAESGAADSPPIVFIHGWGASLYTFRHALDLLPAAGFRVIAPDLRGFGLSDKPRERGAYSLGAFRDDVVALLDALGCERTPLVGQSMGGAVALEVALTHPGRVTALGLINPTGITPIRYIGLLRTAPRGVVRALGRRIVPRWMVGLILRHLAYTDASRVEERDVDEYWSPTQLPGFVSAARATVTDVSWRPFSADRLASLEPPALLLLGSGDRLVHIPDPGARIPSARVHVMNGGHCAHEERPREALDVIARFVRGARV
jgi:pimeloyl-ACP methyl ester carboxylesterase